MVINTPSFGRFWPISWTITHRFGVPKRFPSLSNSKVRLRVGHQQSQFGPILAHFMDYNSPFWGPKAISMVVELQGALTCRLSTTKVWADSGPFLRLLLYFGVSELFPLLTNPGVRLRVGHQHSHIPPILVRFVHYYSAFWGPTEISTIDELEGAFM